MDRILFVVAIVLASFPFSVAQAAAAPPATTGGWGVVKATDGAHTRWLFKNNGTGELFFGLGVQHASASNSVDDLPLGPCSTVHAYDERVKCKYGSSFVWWTYAQKRMQSWGFNMTGPYSDATGAYIPYDTMPFVVNAQPSTYCLKNDSNLAPTPCKDLLRGLSSAVSAQVYTGGALDDIFDPSYTTYFTNRIAGVDTAPYLAAIKLDDEDYTTSWSGTGPDLPSVDGNLMSHAGYLTAVTNFSQSTSKWVAPETYSDTKVYSKYELMNTLVSKYRTIAALNKAWCGATYTSFGDNGGWGDGTGLLDEDGRHPWMGTDPMGLTDACPQTKADLDAFLVHWADHYFSLARAAIKQRFPTGVLIISQTLNNHQGVSRKQVLQEAAQYCDVILVSAPRSQQYVDFTVDQVGDKPILVQFFSSANQDSELAKFGKQNLTNYPSQADRAAAYTSTLNTVFNYVSGKTGTMPYVGYMNWAWMDSWSDKINFGLVDFMDNAYNAVEATTSTSCVDPYGFACGNDTGNFGDFISGVSSANQSIAAAVTNYRENNLPVVNVTDPIAGEKAFSSTPFTIRWNASAVNGVASTSVLVSTNGGSTFSPVPGCSGLPAGIQSCTWNAAGPASTRAVVRVDVTDTAGNVGSGRSGLFTIASGTASIAIAFPNTNVNWGIGSTQQIRWNHNLGVNSWVTVELSRDGGVTWETLNSSFQNTGATSSLLNWQVTGPTTTAGRVRVSWTDGTASAVSAANFTIAAPYIAVSAPSAGVNWGYGTARKQIWTSNLGPFDSVTVRLSTDGGLTFPLALGSTDASKGALTIVTPTLADPTAAARIRVEWSADATVAGVNPANFKVQPAFVTVTKPNLGTDVWLSGSTQTISWQSNLGLLESVNIDLSLDGGASYPINLFAGTVSDGSQPILVAPGWISETALVRIVWTKNASVADTSNQDFPIR